jgi:hypothetical protein
MFEMILGHFIADYLLQPKEMATLKSKNTIEGWYTCICHCTIYTIVVCLMMGIFSPWWIVIVFASHFFIDKFSLAEYWLKFIKGRSIESTIQQYYMTDFDDLHCVEIYKVSFSTLVYTIVDNTWHILLMWAGYKLMFGGV